MYKINTCPVCSSGKLFPWGKEILYKKETYSDLHEAEKQLLLTRLDREKIIRSMSICKSCSFLFQNPVYDTDEMVKLYSSGTKNYADYAKDAGIEKKDLWESPVAIENRKVRQKYYADIILSKGSETVLDYGGGNGANLLDPSIANIDKYVFDIGKQAPANESIKTISNMENGRKYDCIVHTHVLEHEVDPVSSLSKLRNSISDKGFLYLETPFEYTERLLSRRAGAVWHINFFNRKTLFMAAFNAGWGCESIEIKYLPYSGVKIACIVALLVPEPLRNAVKINILDVCNDMAFHTLKRIKDRILKNN